MRRLIVILLLSSSALAQPKHPFTFEDMMKLKRIEEPVPSPDGKWVAFAAVDVDLAANTKTPHIWIVPTAGGESREIIADQDADRPRWAPDGKRLLFLSSKESGQQVWIADFDGSAGTVAATHRLTAIATEADGPLWSPDGKNIIFVSNVDTECTGSPEEAAACNTKELDEAAKSKVKAQIFARLLYRHWNAYKEGKRNHIFAVSPDGGTPRDLTPGDYDSPVFSLGGQDNYAISPDGQELCYTSNHDPVEATSTNNDLWTVPINPTAATISTHVERGASPVSSSPEPKNITAENPAGDSTPLYSPDGKYIAYRAQKRPGYEGDLFRLMLYDRRAGTKRDMLNGVWPDWVGTFIWSPDSSKIFFSSTDDDARNHGQNSISSVSAENHASNTTIPGTGPIVRVIRTQPITRGYDDDFAFSPDGKTLFFTRMSIRRPNEIRKLILPTNIDPYGVPAGDQITHVNDILFAQIQMSWLETFWFEAPKKPKSKAS